jgi:hypothetical protein
LRPAQLFVRRLQLLVDYFARESINRDVQPVPLLAFHDDIGQVDRLIINRLFGIICGAGQ